MESWQLDPEEHLSRVPIRPQERWAAVCGKNGVGGVFCWEGMGWPSEEREGGVFRSLLSERCSKRTEADFLSL